MASPFQRSVLKEKFSRGTFRNAYLATALYKLGPGKFGLKKFTENQVQEIIFLRWKFTQEKWSK